MNRDVFLNSYQPTFGYRPGNAASPAFPPLSSAPNTNRRPIAETSDLRPFVEMARWAGPTKGEDPIFDQGGANACVANAGSLLWRTRLFALAADHNPALLEALAADPRSIPYATLFRLESVDAPSRLVGYLGARRVSGDANWDAGTQIQAWCDYGQRLGLPPENDPELGLAWDPSRVLEHLTPGVAPVCDRAAVQHAANDYKLVDGVYRLDTGGSKEELRDRIEESLSNDEPVQGGFPLDNLFQPLAPGEAYRRTKPIIGHHALAIIGHDPKRYLVANSWSSGWCDRGYGYLDKEWVLDNIRDVHRVGLLAPWA